MTKLLRAAVLVEEELVLLLAVKRAEQQALEAIASARRE